MRKKVLTSAILSVALLSVIGCGGSSDPKTDLAKAYYLDSAVAGINYKCGDIEGITTKDGEFKFEEGSSCTFYLGDVKLRDLDKTQLYNGAKIVETDIAIAQVLQSLDTDGNPDNGITISEDVVKHIDKLPTNDTELEELVVKVKSEVPEFEGEVKTKEEAEQHLEETETKTTKELLADKTFYILHEYDDGNFAIETMKIDKDVTTLTFTEESGETETYDCKIEGNTIIDEDGIHYIDAVTSKYILGHDEHGEFKLYFNKADAEAELEELKQTVSEKMKAIFTTGKVYYIPEHDSYEDEDGNIVNNDHIATIVIKDGEFDISWEEGGSTHYRTYAFTINGDTISFTREDGDDKGSLIYKSENDKGYVFIDAEKKEDFMLYKNKADAEADL